MLKAASACAAHSVAAVRAPLMMQASRILVIHGASIATSVLALKSAQRSIATASHTQRIFTEAARLQQCNLAYTISKQDIERRRMLQSKIANYRLFSTQGDSGAPKAAPAAGEVNPAEPLKVSKLRVNRGTSPIPRSLESPLPSMAELPAAAIAILRKIALGTWNGISWLTNATVNFLKTMITEPAVFKQQMAEVWVSIKHELHHYYVGSKLFASELKTASSLLRTMGKGHELTRRERLQLKRAVGDLLRMVPFIVILIIPFAEFSLPVLLKLFPNMLPSQFEKADYRQETYKKSLNVKLELHGLLQEIVQDQISRSGAAAKDAPTVEALLDQLDAVRAGKPLPADTIVKAAKLFKDDITLDNLPRGQLAAVAKYLGISPFAPEPILRYQLRSSLKAIKADDEDLYKEKTTLLSRSELEQACEARGMRAVGLSDWHLRRQLSDWLELSCEKQVPMTLLVLSRAFQIATVPGQIEPTAEQALQESMSALDKNVVQEVVLAQGEGEQVNAEVMSMKLDSLAFQNELIAAEREARESLHESEKASKEAASTAAALDAAEKDPLLHAQLEKLKAEARNAAKRAEEKKAIAAEKHDVVIRMRARDAALAAAVKAAPMPSEEAAETSALREVAQGATVAREKEILNKIKKARMQIEAAEMLAKGRIGAEAAAAPTDKSTAYLKSKLDSMLGKIEKEYETLKGDLDLKKALSRFDKDKDGIVTKEEIDEALRTIAGSAQSQEAAAALIRYLDSDRDGSVSVDSLQKFLDDYALRVAKAESRSRDADGSQSPAASRRKADASSSDSEGEGAEAESEHQRKVNAAKTALQGDAKQDS